MAFAAPLLRCLLLLCLWPPSGRAAGPPPATLTELHAQLSGVEQLLEDFRRQLQQERPQGELELELRAGGGPQQSCPGPGGRRYSATADAIILTKDSLAAGASFLRAPAAVRDGRQCVAACCSEPRCSVAVVELPQRPAPPAPGLGCYLFNCIYSGRSVCRFSLHPGYSSYILGRALEGQHDLEAGFRAAAEASPRGEEDKPPRSQAGRDVVLRLPADEVTLDGRESADDHAIVRYEWTLLQGDPSVDMKVVFSVHGSGPCWGPPSVAGPEDNVSVAVSAAQHLFEINNSAQVPQPGTLKLSHLREGAYTFQLTVTDTAWQRGSDNVSVTVLPPALSSGGCSKVCSRYHFFCDNGCCIDITLACDGAKQCLDGSDEAFCQELSLERETATHTATAQPGTTGLSSSAAGGFLLKKAQKAAVPNGPPVLSDTEKRNRTTSGGPKLRTDPVVPDSGSLGKNRKEENYIFESKSDQGGAEHLAPEIGAVLPLTLGLAVTVVLLLTVACRLRLVKQRLKKARPTTSEESDYLINGMYL